MRITSGTLKNRKIKSREGKETRPTLERIKEAIFSIIGDKITDARFLDLYSGTGNMAIEALSRGAGRAVMIEQDKEALRIIIDNVNVLKLDEKCRAYKNDVFRALEILGRKNEKFDIIFLDPPYKENITEKTLEKISESEILAEDGIIISEHIVYEKSKDKVGNLSEIDKILEKFENEELSLDDSIAEYEKAIKLIKDSEKLLEVGEGKVLKVLEKNGKLETEEVE